MVTASELVKKQKKKEELKKKVYEKIYERIIKKIKMASDLNFFQCIYEIPELLLGIPIYNLADSIEYVDKKLNKNGFKTQWNNNIAIIDWSED